MTFAAIVFGSEASEHGAIGRALSESAGHWDGDRGTTTVRIRVGAYDAQGRTESVSLVGLGR